LLVDGDVGDVVSYSVGYPFKIDEKTKKNLAWSWSSTPVWIAKAKGQPHIPVTAHQRVAATISTRSRCSGCRGRQLSLMWVGGEARSRLIFAEIG